METTPLQTAMLNCIVVNAAYLDLAKTVSEVKGVYSDDELYLFESTIKDFYKLSLTANGNVSQMIIDFNNFKLPNFERNENLILERLIQLKIIDADKKFTFQIVFSSELKRFHYFGKKVHKTNEFKQSVIKYRTQFFNWQSKQKDTGLKQTLHSSQTAEYFLDDSEWPELTRNSTNTYGKSVCELQDICNLHESSDVESCDCPCHIPPRHFLCEEEDHFDDEYGWCIVPCTSELCPEHASQEEQQCPAVTKSLDHIGTQADIVTQHAFQEEEQCPAGTKSLDHICTQADIATQHAFQEEEQCPAVTKSLDHIGTQADIVTQEAHTQTEEGDFINGEADHTEAKLNISKEKEDTCGLKRLEKEKFPAIIDYDKLLQDMEALFLSGKESDATLLVQDQEFPVHKAILRARSSVLDAMFSHDMVETTSGILTITDFEPTIFHDFLLYLYSGKVNRLSAENVTGLYVAADKYNIPELKIQCTQFMTDNLSLDMFCSVLFISLKHQESALLETCTKFFIKNLKHILITVEWQTFMKENPTAANELYIKASAFCLPPEEI